MFDDLIKRLRALERVQHVEVPVELDDRGYADKQCPAEPCGFMFKVNHDDWRAIFRDEQVTCPRCGHAAEADKWWTTDQINHAKSEAMNWIKGQVGERLRSGARQFNRHFRGHGLLQFSVRVEGERRKRAVLPAAATAALERELSCSGCSARYCVVGTAFFCPCCGVSDVDHSFESGVQRILDGLDSLPAIHAAVTDALGADAAEDFCRSTREALFSDCVSVHQVHCTSQYGWLAPDATPAFNVFQRVRDGGALLRDATGARFEDWLSPAELSLLEMYFQRRHLLTHRDGVVDEKYMTKSGDTSYQAGQRLVVTDDDVREFCRIVRLVGERIRELHRAGP